MLIELLVFAFAALLVLGFLIHPVVHVLAGIAGLFLTFEAYTATQSTAVGFVLGSLSVVVLVAALLRKHPSALA